jgi:excisionase family DNA binding protein
MQKIKKRRKQKFSVEDINRILRRMGELANNQSTTREIDILSLNEMAGFLKVTPTTLKRHVHNNDINAYVAGNGKIYFIRSDFPKSLFSEQGMLSCEDVAQRMRVTTRTVRNWISDGKLVARKYGQKWLIDQEDFADFLELGLYQ